MSVVTCLVSGVQLSVVCTKNDLRSCVKVYASTNGALQDHPIKTSDFMERIKYHMTHVRYTAEAPSTRYKTYVA
jgi:hypothetical protein